ncbi:MAG: transcription factor WhiB [Gordonia sp.]|nr:transcription factor WhiB [Gordonia sp. (in: high G+C Gram-positive bacteria)]
MHARCRGLPLEQFFPAHELSAKSRRLIEDQAKRVCLECPVVLECRMHAITCNEPSGVWGGLTLAERIESTRT